MARTKRNKSQTTTTTTEATDSSDMNKRGPQRQQRTFINTVMEVALHLLRSSNNPASGNLVHPLLDYRMIHLEGEGRRSRRGPGGSRGRGRGRGRCWSQGWGSVVVAAAAALLFALLLFGFLGHHVRTALPLQFRQRTPEKSEKKMTGESKDRLDRDGLEKQREMLATGQWVLRDARTMASRDDCRILPFFGQSDPRTSCRGPCSNRTMVDLWRTAENRTFVVHSRSDRSDCAISWISFFTAATVCALLHCSGDVAPDA